MLAVLIVGGLWLGRMAFGVETPKRETEESEEPAIVGDLSKLRIIAFIVDNVISLLVFLAGGRLLSGAGNQVLIGVGAIGLYLAYYSIFELKLGGTPGKLLVGLRVVDEQGQSPRVTSILLRNVLRLAEANPLLLGGFPAGLAASMTKRKQRVGDLLAHTLVVRKSAARDRPIAASTC
ncbi:MAG: RDD family protein [Thermoanaerobaculia bacterium]